MNPEEVIKNRVKKGKNSVTVELYVRPRSRWTGLCIDDDYIVFYTEANPKRHQANESLIKYLTKQLKRKVQIVSGKYYRIKVVEIKEINIDDAIKTLLKIIKPACKE